ncbi:non-heme iron oxygenase ferredoxin subunit [Candidatus Methylospira mobilis]|uniref:Non-heme iron oxygenase ferredoxin subunit n=1 Tax=Candidatus Methylospira mobilis TaxID=1808979 RepID=A0A5Q0BHJ3_9GAMM|nr:non-heme iron oxygenase ferredoxin subunit [Candidatus Methylospira mobilis]QFY41296.1 non-heme iron oxygenase ferredoxin subunit [Candidatus Methylospira mobilis]WNV05482.1 non-heme iron oxygenase ferredoxin subunit [Candidatus Methylospira mobilis]
MVDANWIDVAPEGNLAPGEHVVVDVNGTAVAVFRIGDEYYAIEDICTHDRSAISRNCMLEGREIICSRHGGRFCLQTGKALLGPVYENIGVFPVRIEQSVIQVREAD